eukprot:4712369-Ditylum_brightwellii.AAC.1
MYLLPLTTGRQGPLPACVMKLIQKRFLYPNSTCTGFREHVYSGRDNAVDGKKKAIEGWYWYFKNV